MHASRENVISHVLFQFKIVRMHMPIMCALYAFAKENKSDLVFSALNNCVQVSRFHSWFGQGRLSKNGDARFKQELPVCEISAHGCASSLFFLLQRTGPCPVCQAKTLTRTCRTNKTLVCSYLQRYNSCHSAFKCIRNTQRTNTIRLRLQTKCTCAFLEFCHVALCAILTNMIYHGMRP